MGNARLAAIIESSIDAIIGKTTDGVVTDWNRAAERMFGYTAEEAIGCTIMDLIVPAELQAEEADILARITRGALVPHLYTQRRRRDGSLIDVAVTVSPIRAPDGSIIGASKIVRDITAQKAVEASYKEAQARLMLVTQANGIGLWDRNLITGMISCDATMLDLFDPDRTRFTGTFDAWRSCVHPDDLAEIDRAMAESIAGKTQLATDFRVITSTGEVRHIGTKATIFYDPAGRPERVLGACFDITRDKQRERRIADLNVALEARTRDAEAATLAKTQFLANISHEIRSPMNAILGMLQLLRESGLSDTQRDYAANALSATRSLLGLLNDLLDFSKIEADKMQLEQHSFSIEALTRELFSILASTNKSADVELRLSIDPRLAASLVGDPYRLRQVLLNLANNALKFTERGEVVIAIQVAARDEIRTVVDFSVSDTGIGIPADRLTHIFHSFSQAEESTTRRYGGTGLGLTISQRLVALMGGRLEVESEQGVGSRFYFTLTFTNAKEHEARPSPAPLADQRRKSAPRLAGSRLLVVEDNLMNKVVARDLLVKEGAEVVVAEGGLRGVQLATAPGARFDAVLMDIHMPDLDGYDATRRIRQHPGLHSLPIIAMTANAMASDKAACAAAGMNGHIAKPIDLDDLVEMVLRHGRPPASPPVAELDVDIALQRLGGNRALFANLAHRFVSDAGDLVAAMQRHFQEGRQVQAVIALHTLKGMAATIGAHSLAQRAGDLEKHLKSVGVPSDLAVRLSAIADLVTSCQRRLQTIVDGFESAQVAAPPTPGTLTTRLRDLESLLLNANLQATQVYQTLRPALQPELEDRLAPLENAIFRLDFKAAAAECSALQAMLA
jgi:PAS domain S-box-containing protein